MNTVKVTCKTIKVKCKNCGNVFDWNDEWPPALKKCPLCGTQN
jgi:predicted  nucleic acid-binding Zn-ribbon protein